MKYQRRVKRVLLAAMVLVAASGLSWGQGRQVVEVEPRAVPGQLDVQEGAVIKIGGNPNDAELQPSSYLWEIVEGEGGRLYHADEAQAVFQAPLIGEQMALFVIQLTVQYPGREPARATLHVRVHAEPPEKAPEKAPEKSIEQVMAEQYAREDEERERKSRQRSNQPVVVHHSSYSSWGYGSPWGWGWGWNHYYPMYVSVPVPSPGTEVGPGAGGWVEPTPLPFEEVATTLPEHIADDYLPQDHPMAAEAPDTAFAGDSPADFIEPPTHQDLPETAPGDMMHDPGASGMDSAEPMMDPGFGFDDYGW